jgi:hypothetical protein
MSTDAEASSSVSVSTEPERFPVKIFDRCSIYRKYIYDVDGRIVRGREDKPISVFDPEIKELIICGRIRFIYDLPSEFRYIITNQEQYYRFRYEREHGSLNRFKYYNVYVDDDVRGKFPVARGMRTLNYKTRGVTGA